jgi:hypothetical protein
MTSMSTLLQKSRIGLFRELERGDPIVRFGNSIRHAAIDLELRSDEELEADGRQHPDAVIREHALYQLIDRKGAEALKVAEEAIFDDPDPQLRVNVLWAIEGLGHERCAKITQDLTHATDSRVQEWARVFAWEMGWGEDFRRAREARHYPNRTFDETLFLHINCDLFVRLSDANDLWGHVRLSPQMLARVYGQALACPRMATREHELVIAKTLKGLHADGSDHHESFLFRGFTERTSPSTGNFYFEAHAKRPFYLSGKADDASEGVVDDVVVPFAREGQWFLNQNLHVDGISAIEYVRGRFQGWAFVNLERVLSTGGDFLFPGNSVLGTLHHPEVGPKTNTFLVGSFKGKVIDWDGDGILDLNYLPAYATRAGEVDSDLDGIPDVPGATVCPHGRHLA